jgi:Na+/H+-dicarboxylate symporter
VDELMDMARTMVNLVGNCLATVVMGRWEGEFKPGTESFAQTVPATTAIPAMAPESSGR